MAEVFQIVFEWPVPERGYEWRRRPGVKDWWLFPVLPGEGEEVTIRKTYPATDTPALTRTFADLGSRMFTKKDVDREEIADFATQYGLLGVGENIKWRGKDVQVESLSAWREAAMRMATFVTAWEAMSWGSLADMNRELRVFGGAVADTHKVTPDGGAVVGNLDWNEELPTLPTLQYRSKRKAAHYIRQVVAAAITDELGQGSSRLFPGARAYPRPVVYPDRVEFRLQPMDLLGYLWLSFGLALDTGTETRTCARCGKYFVVSNELGTRTTRQHCGDTCKTAAYRERMREAKKLAATGRTAKQIAATLSEGTARPVTVKVVQGWIAKP